MGSFLGSNGSLIDTSHSCGLLLSAPKARPKTALGKSPQDASPWVGAPPEMSHERATYKNTAQGAKVRDGEAVTWFHCLFGPSQLRRLGPKRPRNTNHNGALPRATLRLRRRLPWAILGRAFSASAASRPGISGALGSACWPLATARAESPHHGWDMGVPRAACCSTAQLSMADRLPYAEISRGLVACFRHD